MPPKIITPPATEPLTWPEIAPHLRADLDSPHQTYIMGLALAARELVEGVQGRALVTQTLEDTFDCWPFAKGYFELARAPLQSVVSITYHDQDGNAAVWDPANYVVDPAKEPGRVTLAYNQAWPSITLLPSGAITVRYVAGYGNASAVPQRTKQAILLIIGHWYANPEAVVVGTTAAEVPLAAQTLLSQDKIYA